MKLYLDTAVISEIEQILPYGIIDGVTTNPALLAKQNMTYKQAIQKISNLVENGTVFAEVLAENAEEMVREAKEIVTWGRNICIKIPMIPEGIRAVPQIKQLGVPVTVTLIYTAAQAAIASKSGADFVAPFIARAYEFGHDGISLIKCISDIFERQSMNTEILAASIRTANDASQALIAGAGSLTLPTAVIWQMITSPETNTTLNTFLQQYQQKNLGRVLD